MTDTPGVPTRIVRVTQRERQAATAFRHGAPLTEIAACLGATPESADAWLDSERFAEVCQALRLNDPKPRRGRPRLHRKTKP